MSGIYVSPALVALVIFYYMAHKHRSRKFKRRKKLIKKQAETLKIIQAAAKQNL